jgi:D-tyrosyl-tRNA(Tyr) deacylase
MRFLVQVVNNANVKMINKNIINSISKGLLIYVWIGCEDVEDYEIKIDKFISRIGDLKIFKGEDLKINSTLNSIDWEILLISNFTLFARNKKWTSIDYCHSAKSDVSKPIYDLLIDKLKENWFKVKTWIFWEMMQVSSELDGPLNFWLEY